MSTKTPAQKRDQYRRQGMRKVFEYMKAAKAYENLPTEEEFDLDCCDDAPAKHDLCDWINTPREALAIVPMPKSTKQTKRNDEMYVSQDVTVTEKTDESARRKYFLDRVQTTAFHKISAEERFFGLTDDPTPMSPKALVERIQSGKFIFKYPDKSDEETCEPMWKIIWRDPAVKKDQAGFAVALEKLNKLQISTTDAIWAETDITKLPALVTAFESATIH